MHDHRVAKAAASPATKKITALFDGAGRSINADENKHVSSSVARAGADAATRTKMFLGV